MKSTPFMLKLCLPLATSLALSVIPAAATTSAASQSSARPAAVTTGLGALGWPYTKASQVAPIGSPSWCHLWERQACRDWELYNAMYYDVKYGGSRSVSAMTALIAGGGGIHATDAAAVGRVVYSNATRCALDLRAQGMGLLNEQYRKGQFVNTMKVFITLASKAGGKPTKYVWRSGQELLASAAAAGMREFSRQQAIKIFLAGEDKGCF